MQIHNIISVTQFEPYSGADFYKKKSQLNLSSIKEQEGEQYYKINVVINKKMIYRSLQYKIK